MVRIAKTAAAALAVAVGLGACGSSDSSSDGTTTTEPDRAGLIAYAVTGGIAGISERLVIEVDGNATLVSGFKPGQQSTARFTLPDAELNDLRDKLEAADLPSLPKSPETGCADCFEYTLTYDGTTYAADDVSIAARTDPVIQALNRLIANHATSAAAGMLDGK